MLQQILSTPENAVYGVAAFVIMFLNFVGIVLWTALRKKEYLDKMERLPLED